MATSYKTNSVDRASFNVIALLVDLYWLIGLSFGIRYWSYIYNVLGLIKQKISTSEMIKQVKIIFWVLILYYQSVYPQKYADNPLISFEIQKNNYISNIIFKDTNQNIIKTFNVFENNPYNALKYPLEKEKCYNNNVYQTNSAILNKVLPCFDTAYYLNINISNEKVSSINSMSSVYYSEDRKTHIIVYQLRTITTFHSIGVTSTIKILNHKGLIINELTDICININRIGITNDGRYLFITFGMDNESENIFKYGFRIYDLQTRNVIETPTKIEYGGFVTNNLIIIGSDYWENNELLTYTEVYDLYKLRKYSRIFKYDEQKIIEINKSGYLINYKNENRLVLFEKDFKVEQIKL